MESCLSADAWPKRGPLLSEMGPGRASGDVLDDQTATRGMMHPRSTGAAADGAGVRFGEIAQDVAGGMRSGTIRLHAVLPVCSGFWVERSQKEYRQIAYAIFLEDIRFCKDVGVVDRILGHFECMVKRRMSHVRSA